MQVNVLENINRLIKIWAQLSNNVRIRDRTVKAIQYGCQMVMGYYGQQLKEDLLNSLKTTRRTASTSRKAFWLLKSINHMCTFIDLITELNQMFTVTRLFDLLEQFFLILYYFFENIVFLIRVSVVTHITEDDLDTYVNWTNFYGDIAGILSIIIHFIHKIASWISLRQRWGSGNLLTNDPAMRKEAAVLWRDMFDSSLALIIVSVLSYQITSYLTWFLGGNGISHFVRVC